MSFPRVIAHRGAGSLAPENTLAAFKMGASLGHTAFECDVKLSADEECFLLHDDTLDRTTSGHGPAGAHNWSDLSQMDAGSWLSPAYQGTSVASLADIAHFCLPRGDYVNLEIKPSVGTDNTTGRVVANSSAQLWGTHSERLVLSSFSSVALQAAQQAQPHLARAHLFQMLPRDWHTHVTALACQGVVLSQHLVTKAVIEACHAYGWWCASYTVNEWDMAQRLFGWGIDHIVTDEVGLFKP